MISSYFALLVEGNATPDEIDMLWVSENVSMGYFRIPHSKPCLASSPPPPNPSPPKFCISYCLQMLLGIFSLKTVVNAKLMNSSDRWIVSHCNSRQLYQNFGGKGAPGKMSRRDTGLVILDRSPGCSQGVRPISPSHWDREHWEEGAPWIE